MIIMKHQTSAMLLASKYVVDIGFWNHGLSILIYFASKKLYALANENLWLNDFSLFIYFYILCDLLIIHINRI